MTFKIEVEDKNELDRLIEKSDSHFVYKLNVSY